MLRIIANRWFKWRTVVVFHSGQEPHVIGIVMELRRCPEYIRQHDSGREVHLEGQEQKEGFLGTASLVCS